MNAVKTLFDTNILVYAFYPGDAWKRDIARNLIRNGRLDGWGLVSYQVWQEFVSVSTRKFRKRFTLPELVDVMTDLINPMLQVHSSEALFMRALALYEDRSFSWYDSLIVAAALEGRCKVLLTEDMQHGLEVEGLKIINPFHSSRSISSGF